MRWFRKKAAEGEKACESCGAPALPDGAWCNACLAKLTCSFCGKRREEVRSLVAGPSVYICNMCLRLSLEVLDEQQGVGPLDGLVHTMADRLRAGGVVEPDDEVAVVEAGIRIARGRGAPLVELAAAAFDRARPDLAGRALQAVRDEDRDFAWAQHRCAAHYQCGDYDAARAAISDLDLSGVSPADRIRYRLNEISCRLRASPAPASADHIAMAEELDSLRDDATLVLDDAPTWRAFADELRAACFLALGKAAVARDILEAIEADETDAARLTPDGRVLLGDCLAQLGRDAEAREVWRALHEASVDSIRAHHDAAERLSRTTSPYR